MNADELRYLKLLSESLPTIAATSAEITKLSAALSLPKPPELFMSDIHGEYDAFSHLLRNGAGSIRKKIDDEFGDALSESEKRQLATLIYYPHEKLPLILNQVDNQEAWIHSAIDQLVTMLKRISKGCLRSKVRSAFPEEFACVIEELMTENAYAADCAEYKRSIVDSVIHIGRAPVLIEALCLLIQRCSVEHLHLLGDVYDRGPAPDSIMDALAHYPSLDIQWGNHDIVWMGASLGQRGCIAHVVRNCARYGNLSILEDAYGINILPLATFAMEAYRDDPCAAFGLKGNPDLSEQDYEMNVKIQKAMAIIQFKVEGQLIDKYPEFGLSNRKLLDKIDYERSTVVVDGVEYELTDTALPTVDQSDPYRLTPQEEAVMQRLEQAFKGCEKLQRHMRLFLEAGSLYKISDNNLLFHASVPLSEDGALLEANIFGEKCSGKALYDVLERYVHAAFYSDDERECKRGRDLMWWMWLAPESPLFAKSKMATFEIYFAADKAARKEIKNPFYSRLNDPDAMAVIFEDFGMDPASSRIVCGHVPVKAKDGEDPIKCGGQVLTIDGGFSRAYQPTTGIAGYTLISDAHGVVLAAHEPLESVQAAVEQELDIHSSYRVVEHTDKCITVADTAKGNCMKQRVADLEHLLEAYRTNLVAER